MKQKHITQVSSKRGFTLAETLIAMAVAAVVMGGSMTLLIGGVNFSKYNEGKLLVNRDIRKFTTELTDYATWANYFIVYDSFTNRAVLNDGLSGDFLLLVYRDTNEPEKIERLVGYYRAASTNGNEGPVRKFVSIFGPKKRPNDPEPVSSELAEGDPINHIPSIQTINDHSEVIELSKGLSDGRLFYNFFDRSIMVRGEILHQGSNLKRATNTYNFTVSPRG